ncbi:hypothetical protein ACFSTH_05000 [Paenibacillus yanchengensis]|uniref:Hsp20/alpha crystallin family protein n=1 Tax=Paenibacillus yanchengensis TaxID=2035833 RepID=A0ABW4YKW4_9BACL
MSFKWTDLEKWLELQKLPDDFAKLREPGWIEQFVRNIMEQTMPETTRAFMNEVDVAILNEDNYIYLSFKLPDETDVRKLKFYVREDRVKISGFPNGKSKEVKLPELVRTKNVLSSRKDDIIKLRLQKRTPAKAWTEHNFRS